MKQDQGKGALPLWPVPFMRAPWPWWGALEIARATVNNGGGTWVHNTPDTPLRLSVAGCTCPGLDVMLSTSSAEHQTANLVHAVERLFLTSGAFSAGTRKVYAGRLPGTAQCNAATTYGVLPPYIILHMVSEDLLFLNMLGY